MTIKTFFFRINWNIGIYSNSLQSFNLTRLEMPWTFDEFGNLTNLSSLTNIIDNILSDGWVINSDGTATRRCTPGTDCYTYTRFLPNLLEEYRNKGYLDPLERIKADGWVILQDPSGRFYAAKPCQQNASCIYEERNLQDLFDTYNPNRIIQTDGSPVSIPINKLTSSLVPLNQITNISRAFTSQLGYIGDINLNVANFADMISFEINKIQTELFKDVEILANGFLNFSFDEFIQPVNNSLLQMATVPQAILVTPPMFYGSLYENLVLLKDVLDDALYKQINLRDLLPKFFSRCPIFDQVARYAIGGLPEELRILLSNIAGNITGPLNILVGTLQYYAESIYQLYSDLMTSPSQTSGTQYIASITDLIGIIPYTLQQLKNAVRDQLIEFFYDKLSEIPFVQTMMYSTQSLLDTTSIVSSMLGSTDQVISCLSGFGSRNVANLLEEQSRLMSRLRDVQSSPFTEIVKKSDDYLHARMSFVERAIDSSIQYAEDQERLRQTGQLSPDIVGSILSISGYVYSKSRRTQTAFISDYYRLLDNTIITVGFTEEMIWHAISELVIALNGSPMDNPLVVFFRYINQLSLSDLDAIIEKCNSKSSFFFDRFNRFLLYLIANTVGNPNPDPLLMDLNILDALNFTTTFLVHNINQKDSYQEYFNLLKEIIFRGFTIGKIDTDNLETLLVYIKTNNIDNPDLREETRLLALLRLFRPEELQNILENYSYLTNFLDPAQPMPDSDIDPTLVGEVDEAAVPDYLIYFREASDDWSYYV